MGWRAWDKRKTTLRSMEKTQNKRRAMQLKGKDIATWCNLMFLLFATANFMLAGMDASFS